MVSATTHMAKPRALITGIRGFTGGYVAAELRAHGWDVWGLGSHPDVSDPQYRCADLLDVPSLRSVVADVQPDVVVHLAAIAFVGHGDVGAFYRVNLLGSRNLLAALAQAEQKPSCVLLASSANVYGNSGAGVLTESTIPNPANDYAVSKLAMEHMARLWMDRLPIVIARPFNYVHALLSWETLMFGATFPTCALSRKPTADYCRFAPQGPQLTFARVVRIHCEKSCR